MNIQDRYLKLRPRMPTPAEEMCKCDRLTSITLRYSLSDCPLHCLECNGEVAPEYIDIPGTLVDGIAHWCANYSALYQLWVDSGEYEEWAAARLLDKSGEVNVEGQLLASELNDILPTYYWWFSDFGEDGYIRAAECPVCSVPTEDRGRFKFRFCNNCRIAH